MSTTVRPSAPAAVESKPTSQTSVIAGILLIGLALRIAFINAEGFRNDISSFEAWTLTLAQHPLSAFYHSTGFADYPPGYFYVLWVVGKLYTLLVHSDPSYAFLKVAIKLPAILMDLVDAVLIAAIARRFAPKWAPIAAGAYVLNPVTIFVSAYWGQVDSVAAGFVLVAVLLIVYCERWTPRVQTVAIVGAWLSLAYSILIKPQAAIVAALLLAYPFAAREPAIRRLRLGATALGVVAALLLADLAAWPFNPAGGFAGALGWLYQRYAFGSNVYPYNTVNAFNLYAVFRPFWQPDNAPIQIGSLTLGSMAIWGILLVLAATALVVARYLQRRTDDAFLEGTVLLTLAFFILATRMHERYVFNAFALLVPAMALGRRFVYAAIVLSLTFLVNLVYSFVYLNVVLNHVAGVDPTNMWPIAHVLALANVALFFALGYVYLGGVFEGAEQIERRVSHPGRTWFNPFEGLTAWTRIDYWLAGAFTLGSFILCFAWYWIPGEKIFDEIYYARAGEEYLRHVDLFEWTHPPLTKLLITFSMILFGGLRGLGDTSVGWRFLNVVVGAATVWLLYAFAKRLLGSTFFAAIAAGLLTFDGFHFVQSRIATPEITVAFFALATLYTFYRFWIAAQVRRVEIVPARWGVRFWLVMAAGVVVALGFSWFVNRFGTTGPTLGGHAAAFLYALSGAYLIARLVAPRSLPRTGAETSYAEGSVVVADGGRMTILASDGSVLPSEKRQTALGPLTRAGKGEFVLESEELHVTYAPRNGTMRYSTPEGEATFAPEGTMATPVATIRPDDGVFWFAMVTIAAAAVADSKWNGLFDFWVIWFVALGVVAQRFFKRLAVYGNPFGFSMDVLVVGMCFVAATWYVISYIPFFALGHNLSDLVSLQQQMFAYHDDLKATHPYGSVWWQWPILQRPISYYYHDFRVGAAVNNGAACCVAEILALPNPAVWWLGLLSVPFIAYLAWRERNKGFTLLVAAYLLQWLPWMASPRVAFEYHFFPNLAVICLADAALLQRLWRRENLRWIVWTFLGLVLALFVYFYPILAGVRITYDDWHAHMWTWLMGNHWI